MSPHLSLSLYIYIFMYRNYLWHRGEPFWRTVSVQCKTRLLQQAGQASKKHRPRNLPNNIRVDKLKAPHLTNRSFSSIKSMPVASTPYMKERVANIRDTHGTGTGNGSRTGSVTGTRNKTKTGTRTRAGTKTGTATRTWVQTLFLERSSGRLVGSQI